MVKRGPLSVFQGSQGYMYAVALLAWANYSGYQLDFAAENSSYTEELADEQTAAIKAARDQPNVEQGRCPHARPLAASRQSHSKIVRTTEPAVLRRVIPNLRRSFGVRSK